MAATCEQSLPFYCPKTSPLCRYQTLMTPAGDADFHTNLGPINLNVGKIWDLCKTVCICAEVRYDLPSRLIAGHVRVARFIQWKKQCGRWQEILERRGTRTDAKYSTFSVVWPNDVAVNRREAANGIKLILRRLPSGINDKFNLKM